VNVAPAATPVEAVMQHVYPVGGQQKSDLLVQLINSNDLERVLVFTRTKHRADRVARVLERSGIRGAAIHGDRSQAQRQKALDGFKQGRLPRARSHRRRRPRHRHRRYQPRRQLRPAEFPEDYVHRIGRTARAGASGTAVSLLAPEEHEALREIERKIGTVLECTDVEGFDYTHDRLVPSATRDAVAAKPRTVYSGAS